MYFWRGSTGKPVAMIQKKLGLVSTGLFDEATDTAVRAWQRRAGLKVDGIVGPATLASLRIILTPPDTTPTTRPMSHAERAKVAGSFKYRVLANGQVDILDDWAERNLVEVFIPALAGKPLYSLNGKRFDGHLRCHSIAAPIFAGFFDRVVREGLESRILTFDGGFCARLVRGGNTLSNHAYGLAIDINAEWNGLGKAPAQWCRPGSVLDLVPIAHAAGLYWGGNFSRRDGMHFEVASQ